MNLSARIGALLGARRTTLSPQEAASLQAGGALLLDVRTREEHRAGHAPRSRSIPLDQLPTRLREIPADRKLLTICRSGARSARAAALLRREGYEVLNVRGGMLAWQRAGLPIQGSGRSTRI